MTREQLLAIAQKVVMTERNNLHGSPEKYFRLVARLWSDYLGVHVGEVDAALMMALLKIAHTTIDHDITDSLVGLANCAACAAEVAGEDGR